MYERGKLRGGTAGLVQYAPLWLLELSNPDPGRRQLYREARDTGLIKAAYKACAAQAKAFTTAADEGLRLAAGPGVT